MRYIVHTVGEDELPEGVERLIVDRGGDPPILLISGEAARVWRFMRAWEDSHEPDLVPSMLFLADAMPRALPGAPRRAVAV